MSSVTDILRNNTDKDIAEAFLKMLGMECANDQELADVLSLILDAVEVHEAESAAEGEAVEDLVNGLAGLIRCIV